MLAEQHGQIPVGHGPLAGKGQDRLAGLDAPQLRIPGGGAHVLVFGRDDVFAKRTDMPLWQALAKEQGIEIFLNVPKAPDATPAEENTITNAQIKLDLNEPLVSDPQQQPGDNTEGPAGALAPAGPSVIKPGQFTAVRG